MRWVKGFEVAFGECLAGYCIFFLKVEMLKLGVHCSRGLRPAPR